MHLSDNDLPAELVGAVRAAAGAVPPYPGDLAAVRHRGRTRQRRRRGFAAGGLAAAAVAAVIGLPPLLAAPADPDRAGVTALSPVPASGQRLLVGGGGFVVRASPGAEADLNELTARELYDRYHDDPRLRGVLGEFSEVLPDGRVRDLHLDYLDPPGLQPTEVTAMPDGRIAVLGSLNQPPDVDRADGECVDGVGFLLTVVETDGSVSTSRDVRVPCQQLRLLDADATTAYLLRDSTVVAHDLATGAETRVLDASALGPAMSWSRSGQRWASVVDTIPPPADECGDSDIKPAARVTLRWQDGPDGAVAERVLGHGCQELGGPVRLSPDGQYAAVAFHRFVDADTQQLRVAVLELDSGELITDRLISEVTGASRSAYRGAQLIFHSDAVIGGLAWQDQTTLRVAWYPIPPEGLHWVTDLIQVEKVTVS